MAPKDTSLQPKVRKTWKNSGIETTPSADDNLNPTEHPLCPEIVEIMAKYGQTPADLIVSDESDDEDEIDTIPKDSNGEHQQFPTYDTASTHYSTKTAKSQLPPLKIKIRGFRAGPNREKSSTSTKSPTPGPCHGATRKPASAIHPDHWQEDNTEPNDTQEHSDDNQEKPKTSLKRRRDYESSESKDVERKEKKSKKEAAPQCQRPRGRPRKEDTSTKAGKKHEKEFSMVVYVEVAVPPKLHAGKTHKGDKMVPQAPRRCGPFSMFQKMKWLNFLENISSVTRIDKENLLLPGMTWRMQGKKEQDGLPLQSRDAFKAMRNILKNKAQKEQPILLIHHPIATGGEKQTNNEASTALETTRWSEKLSLDDQLKPIVEQLKEEYTQGNCAEHQDVRCFHTYTAIENGIRWHIPLDDRRLKVWAAAILRKEASIGRAPIGKHLFQPKDRLRVLEPSGLPSTPTPSSLPYPAHTVPGYAGGWPHAPMTPGGPLTPSPFYHPPFYSPMALGHAAAQMSPWGFTGSNHLINGLGAQPSSTMLSANIEEWCNKHNLGVEECKGLIKLGFHLDKPEELDDLDEATWASVGLGLLHQHRIKAACAASN